MYKLGPKSLAELEGVHPDMVACVKESISTTLADYVVFEGVRSVARQRELVKAGSSKTMNSKHIIQADGFSHAVDLVPWIAGKARWDWGPIYNVAYAMRDAAIKLNVQIVWGGIWDKVLNDIPGRLEDAVKEYCVRHPGPDFLDGPHFQLKKDA